jgi:non-specific serine/threonine protein kinase
VISSFGGSRATAALGQIAQRYGRALGIHARDVGDALQSAREALRKGTAAQASERTLTPETREPEPVPAAK